jgi:hypothetical protein
MEIPALDLKPRQGNIEQCPSFSASVIFDLAGKKWVYLGALGF